MPTRHRQRRRPGSPALRTKVPEITAIFWLLKLISTGMGEAMSDWAGTLSATFGAVAIVVGFGVAMRLQLRQKEYVAPYYWFAVMMVAVFGTMVADAIHNDLGAGYAVTTPAFAIITGVIFLRWYRSEHTLSIHTINTARRERFYWGAVLGTFALGTAAGDLTAATLNLGYAKSILVFAAIIAIPALGWWRLRWNPIFAFWFAYVITRPLGASIADALSKSSTGLGLGDGGVSIGMFALFVPIVAWVTLARVDVQRTHREPSRRGASTTPVFDTPAE